MNEKEELKIIKEVLKQVAGENKTKDLDFTLEDLYNGLVKLKSKPYMKPFLKTKISTLLKTKKYLQKISDGLGIAGMLVKPVFYVPSFLAKKLGGEKWVGKKIKKTIIKKLSRVVAEEMYKDRPSIKPK